MHGDYAFDALKLSELADHYLKEKGIAQSLYSQIKTAQQNALPEKQYIYLSVLNQISELIKLFSNLSSAACATSNGVKNLMLDISTKIEDNIDSVQKSDSMFR